MIHQVKTAFHRAQPTLLNDVLGAGALVVMLVAALHLPSVI